MVENVIEKLSPLKKAVAPKTDFEKYENSDATNEEKYYDKYNERFYRWGSRKQKLHILKLWRKVYN